MTTTTSVLCALRDHYQQMADSGMKLSFASFDEAAEHARKLLRSSFVSRMPLSMEQLVLKFFDINTLRYWKRRMAMIYHIDEAVINYESVYLLLTTVISRSFFDELTHLRICAVMPDATKYRGYFTQMVLANEAEFDLFQEEYIKLNSFLRLVNNGEYQKISVLPVIHLVFSEELTQQLLDGFYLAKTIRVIVTNSAERLTDEDYVRADRWMTHSQLMDEIGMHEADEEFTLTGECDDTQRPLRPIREDDDRVAYILRTKFIEHITLTESSTAFLDHWYSLNHNDKILCRAAALLELQVLCERADDDNGLSDDATMPLSQGALNVLDEDCFAKYIMLSQLRERANDKEQYPEIWVLYNSICKETSFDENLIEPAECLFEGILKFVTDNSKTKSYTQVCNAYSSPDIFTACQALKYYRGDDVYHAVRRRAKENQQKGLQKAYGTQARKMIKDEQHKSYRQQQTQHTPHNKPQRERSNSVEHEFMTYTSITPASLLLGDNMAYQALRTKYNELQIAINSAYSRLRMKDPEQAERAKRQYDDLRLKECRTKFDLCVQEIKAVSHALNANWSEDAIVDAARKFTAKDYIKVVGTNVIVEYEDEIKKFGIINNVVITIDE